MPKNPTERFPGFAPSMAMLRNRKNAEAQETGYQWLLPRVGDFIEPLLAELEVEGDPYMQRWILELLGEARDVRAFQSFMQHLLSQNASVRQWAESGLQKLGQTREGRKTMWAALQEQESILTSANEHDEPQVREALARILEEPRQTS